MKQDAADAIGADAMASCMQAAGNEQDAASATNGADSQAEQAQAPARTSDQVYCSLIMGSSGHELQIKSSCNVHVLAIQGSLSLSPLTNFSYHVEILNSASE